MPKDKNRHRFELVKTRLGVVTIKNMELGEILHNPLGPWREANDLYVNYSNIKQKFMNLKLKEEPLVLFDLGLGAGTNAIAVIDLTRNIQNSCRPLKIISFENDLGLLEFALQNSSSLEFMEKDRFVLQELLDKGCYSCGNICWEIRNGEFTHFIAKESNYPEVIFFDFYSPNVAPQIWGLNIFQNLFGLCIKAKDTSILVTYSRSTAVRTAMLMAGFTVGMANGLANDHEGTVAATESSAILNPLDNRWLQRWRLSSRSLPFDLDGDSHSIVNQAILEHRQFSCKTEDLG